MNIRRLITGLAAITVTVSSAAIADEIYKWTDENGNVHYEDRPSGKASEERLQMSYSRTDRGSVDKRVQALRDSTSERVKAREEADAAAQTAAEERAAAEQQAAKCEEYRGKLKTMLASRRLYREDAAGERVYLDDEARAEARRKAEELIKETCDG